MKSVRFWMFLGLSGCFVALSSMTTQSAKAVPQFKKQFEAKYVQKDSTDPTQMAFAEVVKKAKCNVCHVKGKKKKENNVYGQALSELLDHKKDKKDMAKIVKALEEVDAQNSVEGDASSPSWGELFAKGELPPQP